MSQSFAEAPWPRYCCAILRDQAGRYLLEQRLPNETHAAGLITCFGGTREEGEHPDACIVRELREELGIAAPTLRRAIRLVSDHEIAWFYRGDAPSPDAITLEADVAAVWATPEELFTLKLGGWHRAVLEADVRGQSLVLPREYL